MSYSCVLEDDKSKLVVSGYSRKKYSHSVPVAILSLVQSFYTFWKKRRLTKDEMQMIDQMENGEELSIALHTVRIGQIPLNFCIQAKRESSYTGLHLRIYYPDLVDFIAGHFWAGIPSTEPKYVSWKTTKKTVIEGQQLDHLSLCFVGHSDSWRTGSFDCYYDIHQIAFSPKTKIPNFDVTPAISGGVFEWDIDCSQHVKPGKHFFAKPFRKNGCHWEFYWEHGVCGQCAGDCNCVELYVYAAFLPMKVMAFDTKINLRLKSDGFEMEQEDTDTCSIEPEDHADVYPSLKFEMDKEVLVNNSKISARITVQIIRAWDIDEKEIDTNQYERFGIVSSS